MQQKKIMFQKKNEIVSSEVKEENLKEIKKDKPQLDTKKSMPNNSLDKNKILSSLASSIFKTMKIYQIIN